MYFLRSTSTRRSDHGATNARRRGGDRGAVLGGSGVADYGLPVFPGDGANAFSTFGANGDGLPTFGAVVSPGVAVGSQTNGGAHFFPGGPRGDGLPTYGAVISPAVAMGSQTNGGAHFFRGGPHFLPKGGALLSSGVALGQARGADSFSPSSYDENVAAAYAAGYTAGGNHPMLPRQLEDDELVDDFVARHDISPIQTPAAARPRNLEEFQLHQAVSKSASECAVVLQQKKISRRLERVQRGRGRGQKGRKAKIAAIKRRKRQLELELEAMDDMSCSSSSSGVPDNDDGEWRDDSSFEGDDDYLDDDDIDNDDDEDSKLPPRHVSRVKRRKGYTVNSSKPSPDNSSKQTMDNSSKPTTDNSSKPTDDSSKPATDDSSKPTTDNSSKPTTHDTSKPRTHDTSEPTTYDPSNLVVIDDDEPRVPTTDSIPRKASCTQLMEDGSILDFSTRNRKSAYAKRWDDGTKDFLPSTSVDSHEERKLFCDSVLRNKKFKHLLMDYVYNVCFVFEENREELAHLEASGGLTNLGKLCLRRWSTLKAVRTIHVLFPSDDQIYDAKHAEFCHYQSMFKDIVVTMDQLGVDDDVTFQFYSPWRDHDSDFLSVRNGNEARQYTNRMDWLLLYRRMRSSAVRVSATASRQVTGYSADFGFTNAQASNWIGSTSGLSIPPMKPDSQVPEVVGAVVALGDAADSIIPRWRTDLYSTAVMQSLAAAFCRRLGDGVLFASIHLGVTGPPGPPGMPGLCGAHNDNMLNSKLLKDVFCASVIVGGVRISINCQQRKAIDDLDIKERQYAPLLRSLTNCFHQLPQSQKFISEELYKGEKVEYFRGYPMIRNKCNADPLGHSQPVMDMIIRLAMHFSLTTLEIFGLHYAAQCVGHTTMMFWTAGLMLLQLPRREGDRPPYLEDCRRGWGFGYLVLLLQVDLYNDLKSRNIKQHNRRYTRYADVVAEDENLFKIHCHDLASLALHQWASDPLGASSEKKRDSNYKAEQRMREKYSGRNQGHLANTHAELAGSRLGTLVSWHAGECIIMNDARYIEHINTNFNLQLKAPGINHLFGTARQRFKVDFGISITKRWFENFLCKWYRNFEAEHRGRLLQWCDLLGWYQLLFSFTDDGFFVMDQRGERQYYEGDSLISTFPYGRESVSMSEIVEDMGLPTTMPSVERISKYDFKKHPKLCHPTTTIGVQFHVPKLPPLSGEALDTTRRFLTRYLHKRGVPGRNQR